MTINYDKMKTLTKIKTRRKNILLIIILFVIGSIIVKVCSEGTPDYTSTTVPEVYYSDAQIIAAMDAETSDKPPLSDSRVQEIQRHITSIAKDFKESQSNVARYTVNAHKEAIKLGSKVTIAGMLADIDKESGSDMSSVRYSEFLAGYLVLINKSR